MNNANFKEFLKNKGNFNLSTFELDDEAFNRIINEVYPERSKEIIIDKSSYIDDKKNLIIRIQKAFSEGYAIKENHLYEFSIISCKSGNQDPNGYDILKSDIELSKVWRRELKRVFGDEYVAYVKTELEKQKTDFNLSIDEQINDL